MQRFKPGDAVFILPKFSHLYSGHSAIVRAVKLDPHRAIFNTYAVEFADASISSIFEFQIIDNPSNYNTIVAALAFDSRRQTAAAQARGASADERIILQTQQYDVDLKIRATKSRASVMGQILERGTTNLLKQVPVHLMKESTAISATASDNVGAFKFIDVPRGSLNILVIIPQNSVRILGSFTI